MAKINVGFIWAFIRKLQLCRTGFPIGLCEVSPNPAGSVMVSWLVCADLLQDGLSAQPFC